jgi:hypothetical protein
VLFGEVDENEKQGFHRAGKKGKTQARRERREKNGLGQR